MLRRFSQARLGLLTPLAALLALAAAAQPWGNYPINDDWIYARILRSFVATGKFVFDHDSGSAFIGQGLLASLVVRLFGFSHTHLRELTLAVSAALLWLLWRLLSDAGVRPAVKAMAILTVAWNPVYAALSLSFLTEIYGYALALLAAVFWFGGRRPADPNHDPAADRTPLVSWPAALLTGLAAGGCFWIRQYCVLVFPALVSATVFGAWLEGSRRRLLASAVRMAASCVAFVAAIAGYFLFVRYDAVVPMTDFQNRLHRLGAPLNPGVPLIESGIFLTYMTAFLLPLIALFPLKRFSRKMIATGAGLFVLGLLAALMLLAVPSNRNLNPVFPFLSNLVYNAGVGAILLPDVLMAPLRPRWSSGPWIAIECVLLAANVLWAFVTSASWRRLRNGRNDRGAEILGFGALFAIGNFAVTTVVDGLGAFDRYALPEFLGLTLVAAIAFSGRSEIEAAPARRLFPRFAAALLPIAFFSFAGLHDFFRWNDARWSLFHDAVQQGVSPANLGGGYEINGWANYDFILRKTTPPACIGPCTCVYGWYCVDDSYRIGMNVYGDYELVASRLPDYWLAQGPPILLSRRRPPQASAERATVGLASPHGPSENRSGN